ncbi:hypothetical protein FHX48_001479 [Microbacterium halimionae]|uniref:DUF4184 family protein n=1 Tax=Microbacterium halimionae TaxID=1526413 RepID=A0A7W3JP69_9MICO|nr:DUF4184 family protein [Microbacterium halimionae]MBA8816406.1 hypothetical protein [Microbacterium halimionae]NII95408.1 hypothetical protein [Microbacterium halimionae]
MPFTPSHAVVALPFLRTPLVPAAIAVGAMTPDLPLFLRGTPLTYNVTHTWAWIPLTAVTALVLLLLWRCVMRPAAVELLPAPLAGRLPKQWWTSTSVDGARETFRGGVSGILLLLASLAIGVASHLAWDAFTHEGRWGSALLPALDAQWGPIVGYKWLQHGSSAFGLIVLAIWAVLWLRKRMPMLPRREVHQLVRLAWWMSLPLVLVLAWVGGWLALGPLDAEFTIAHLAYRVLPPAAALWGIGTVVLCLSITVMRDRSLISRRKAGAADRDTPGAHA